MDLFNFLALCTLSTISQAAKKGDDDEWVNLPNKCEGNTLWLLTISSLYSLLQVHLVR